MKTAALFLLIVASAPGDTTSADEQDATQLENAMTNAASMLAQRSDADSLAAAAVLTRLTDSTLAEQLAARASAAAPQRPDLLWLQAQLCKEVPGCDRKPLDSKLHALDPENGAIFLPRLQDVGDAMDPVETDRLLAAAAASKRVDFYWNRLISRLAPAVLSTKTLPPGQSLTAVIGAASGVVIPALAGAGVPCRDWVRREERRTQCKAIARAFLQGDTVIAQVAGANMTQALWPADSPETRAAKEASRTLTYQISTNGADSARRLLDEAGVRRYLDKMARYRREQDLIVAELVDAGRSPLPPADWRAGPPPNGAPATR
ncbi:MAG: hypothetical protein WDO68_02900 [Gammaproteobacteria bacterium]